MPTLEDLPPELHVMIYRMLDSTWDMRNCMEVSRTLYQSFHTSRSLHMLEKLDRSICEYVQPYALALNHITGCGCCPDDEINTGWPSDLASLEAMSERHGKLMAFIKHFTHFALAPVIIRDSSSAIRSIYETIFPEDIDREFLRTGSRVNPVSLPHWAALNMSHKTECRTLEDNVKINRIEMAKLQCAFYAYERSCQLNTMKETKCKTLLAIDQQYAYIFEDSKRSREEEEACVHQYYVTIAGVLYDQTQSEFIDDILALPNTFDLPPKQADRRSANEPGRGSSQPPLGQHALDLWKANRQKSLRHKEEDGFCGLGIDSHYLGAYLPQFNSCHQRFHARAWLEASFLAVKGIDYFTNLLIASKDSRIQILKENLKTQRARIPKALAVMQHRSSLHNYDPFIRAWRFDSPGEDQGFVNSDLNSSDLDTLHVNDHSRTEFDTWSLDFDTSDTDTAELDEDDDDTYLHRQMWYDPQFDDWSKCQTLQDSYCKTLLIARAEVETLHLCQYLRAVDNLS